MPVDTDPLDLGFVHELLPQFLSHLFVPTGGNGMFSISYQGSGSAANGRLLRYPGAAGMDAIAQRPFRLPRLQH
jgi:hypothetical protein